MIVLVSFIVLLRELVSTIFRMVHPYIAIHSVFLILLRVERSYAHAQVSATSRVSERK